MKHKICKFGEKCRFLHPKKPKPLNQTRKERRDDEKSGEEKKNTPVRLANEPLQTNTQLKENGVFLGHNTHQTYWGKENQNQIKDPFLDPQQRQMMEYMMILLNQRLNSIVGFLCS